MTDTPSIKHMSIKEFREIGFLQEANRQFFHPLGLALEVTTDAGEERLSGVWDYREDPEGMSFTKEEVTAPEFRQKVANVNELRRSKTATRLRNRGCVIQPPWDTRPQSAPSWTRLDLPYWKTERGQALLHPLFDTVTRFVLESGGDGDGWIICPNNYKDLADEFEIWQKDHGFWTTDAGEKRIHFPNRKDYEGEIYFTHYQESVAFVDDTSRLPIWAGDIIVKLH